MDVKDRMVLGQLVGRMGNPTRANGSMACQMDMESFPSARECVFRSLLRDYLLYLIVAVVDTYIFLAIGTEVVVRATGFWRIATSPIGEDLSLDDSLDMVGDILEMHPLIFAGKTELMM